MMHLFIPNVLRRGWMIALVLIVTTGILPGVPARAAESANSSEVLGPPFESRGAGISLRPPASAGKIIHHSSSPDEIAQFISDSMKWQLNVSKLTFRQGIELTSTKDAAGKDQPGLLELTTSQFKADHADAQVLRQDVISVGGCDVGMIAMRYSLGNQRCLLQQALMQSSNQLYYLLTFTSPGAPANVGDGQPADPNEQQAVAVFRKVIDSVKLLDRGAIRQEQDVRLGHTRVLYMNTAEARLRKALVPRQYLRLLRDGKDIGYTCVFEEVDASAPNPGVQIMTRAHTVPDKDTVADVESVLKCAFDRRHEQWNSAATVSAIAANGKPQSDTILENGVFDRLAIRAQDAKTDADGVKNVHFADTYTLTVTTSSGRGKAAEPFTQQVPPFYLPQALGHLLPRLVPLKEPQSYMFATWVSDQHAVVARYIDVGDEQVVTIGNQHMQAIPVRDRVGIDGSVTTHFMSPQGAYLASVNPDSHITILPSDEATLGKLWPQGDFSKPVIKTDLATTPR